MAKASGYDEVAARRRNAMAPDARAERDVFAEAYDIAMQVFALRERAGLTQAELAARTGIDQGGVSRIERGATSPTARTLHRIAEALDADVKLVARVH